MICQCDMSDMLTKLLTLPLVEESKRVLYTRHYFVLSIHGHRSLSLHLSLQELDSENEVYLYIYCTCIVFYR